MIENGKWANGANLKMSKMLSKKKKKKELDTISIKFKCV